MVSARKRKATPNATESEPQETLVAVGTLTSKGQITIPKHVREYLLLQPGDRVEFVEVRGRMIVRKEFDASVFDEYRGMAKWLKGRDPDDLIEEWRGP